MLLQYAVMTTVVIKVSELVGTMLLLSLAVASQIIQSFKHDAFFALFLCMRV